MTKNALEKMEAGGVVMANKDGFRHIRFWGITLLFSIAIMAISLLIFCLTGKANNMEKPTAYAIIFTARQLIILYVGVGGLAMWIRCDHPPQEIGPADRAGLELIFVVLICIVTLLSGKIVEVFFYTMSSIIGLVAILQLLCPTVDPDDYDMMNHLWFTFGLGTITGLVCLIPYLFFFLGWFSIFVLTFVYIVRYNFPDKTLVEAFAMVSEVLERP